MARLARVIIPDCPHHVTQRGNRGENVFFSKADRIKYLTLLSKYSQKYRMEIQAYCLMPNHVHLIVVPRSESSMAETLRPLNMCYARHINHALNLDGRLWQGRFFSCPLDEEHLWAAVRYVERNPVRAGLTESAEEYSWSSAADHCGLRKDVFISDPCNLTLRLPSEEWRKWLREPWEAKGKMLSHIRQCTHTGRPAGGEEFVTLLEGLLGRVLTAEKVGRPGKHKTGNSEKEQPLFLSI